MRYFGVICVVLLTVIVGLQIRILSRLEKIATQPVVGPAPSIPHISSAKIATEILKQEAKMEQEKAAEIQRLKVQQSPPNFHFVFRDSNVSSSGKLEFVDTAMTRVAGQAREVAIKAAPGIVATISAKSSENDSDTYLISFKPESEGLPRSWNFSILFKDYEGRSSERQFTAHYADVQHFRVTDVK